MDIFLKTYEIALVLLCLFGIVLINPIGDAIRDNGNKRAQKNIELLRDLLFWVIIYLTTKELTFVILSGLSYFFLRIALHNLAYNLSRRPKLPWYYVGTTSKSDDIEKELGFSKKSILIGRIVSFLFAILLYIISFR